MTNIKLNKLGKCNRHILKEFYAAVSVRLKKRVHDNRQDITYRQANLIICREGLISERGQPNEITACLQNYYSINVHFCRWNFKLQ